MTNFHSTTNTNSIPAGLSEATTGMSAFFRRSPVLILADRSLSMKGTKIDGLNDGLDLLVSELRSDPIAAETVVLNVITFGGTVDATGFMPIDETSLRTYNADGNTPMGAAMHRAANELDATVSNGNAEQKGDYLAHVWLISDGCPTDSWMTAADVLRNMPQVGMVNAIAVGAEADTGVLAQIVGGKGQVLRLEAVTHDVLKSLFKWVSQVTTMATASRQSGAAPTTVAFPSGLIPAI